MIVGDVAERALNNLRWLIHTHAPLEGIGNYEEAKDPLKNPECRIQVHAGG